MITRWMFLLPFCWVCFSSLFAGDVSFPTAFLWGCADSALQIEGMESVNNRMIESSWTQFEKTRSIAESKRVGVACEHWKRYEDDIQLMREIGMNARRFSIAWEKIEPQEGIFDQMALDHYKDEIKAMRSCGIMPMITLFHHNLPVWFAKKGGFAHKKNNKYFIRFARHVYKQLHEIVPFWITLNEPVAYAIEAYWRSNYPPGERSFIQAGRVALQLLDLHVITYYSLKQIDSKPRIGIAHVMNLIDPYHKWNPLEVVITKLIDYVVNNLTIDYFKTGRFNWLMMVRKRHKRAIGALDFIGVNYYTHTILKQTDLFNIEPVVLPHEKQLTESIGDGRGCKVIYPEGLYRCIKRASILNIPMYIAENGSSTDDPTLTELYIKQHLTILSRAIKDGFNVRGYFYWTLMDCFGWKKGYEPKQGMYHVDFQTQERTLRPAFAYLIDLMKQHTAIT